MLLGASATSVTFAGSALAAVAGLGVFASLMVEASGAAGAFVCGGAIEGAAVGLVLRLSRLRRRLAGLRLCDRSLDLGRGDFLPARCPLDDDLVARFVWRRWRGKHGRRTRTRSIRPARVDFSALDSTAPGEACASADLFCTLGALQSGGYVRWAFACGL